MARRTTTTRGIGTGTAQIFDTSQSQRAFERGQGIQAQKRQQDAAARKKAVDDAMAEVQSLLDEDVWETRDRATYQQAYNDLMSQYDGRWQEVYSDPKVYSELISGVGKVKNLGRRSVEHKDLVLPFVKSTYSNPKMQEYITEEGRQAVKNLQTPRALTDPEYFKENWEIANTFATEEINPLERFGELFNRNAVEVVADGTRVVNGQKISSGSTYVPRTPKGDNPGFDNTALSIVKNMNAAERQAIGEKYGDGELTDEAIKAFIDDAYGTYAAGRSDDYSVTPFDDGTEDERAGDPFVHTTKIGGNVVHGIYVGTETSKSPGLSYSAITKDGNIQDDIKEPEFSGLMYGKAPGVDVNSPQFIVLGRGKVEVVRDYEDASGKTRTRVVNEPQEFYSPLTGALQQELGITEEQKQAAIREYNTKLLKRGGELD